MNLAEVADGTFGKKKWEVSRVELEINTIEYAPQSLCNVFLLPAIRGIGRAGREALR
jgi:hypothetical protein